jgi:hypothetical protein
VIFYFLLNLSPLELDYDMEPKLLERNIRMHDEVFITLNAWFRDVLSPEDVELVNLRHRVWLTVRYASDDGDENSKWTDIICDD